MLFFCLCQSFSVKRPITSQKFNSLPHATQHLECLKLKRSQEPLCSEAYVSPVTEGSIERLSVWVEQVSDVTETGDLKNLRLLLNHLPEKTRGGFIVTEVRPFQLEIYIRHTRCTNDSACVSSAGQTLKNSTFFKQQTHFAFFLLSEENLMVVVFTV